MSEIRQLLRFEIPGLILIIDIALTLICFVDLSEMFQDEFTQEIFNLNSQLVGNINPYNGSAHILFKQ
jgi:hypothetical protein